MPYLTLVIWCIREAYVDFPKLARMHNYRRVDCSTHLGLKLCNFYLFGVKTLLIGVPRTLQWSDMKRDEKRWDLGKRLDPGASWPYSGSRTPQRPRCQVCRSRYHTLASPVAWHLERHNPCTFSPTIFSTLFTPKALPNHQTP